MTLGAAYWFWQRSDGSGPILSGIMEDTGFSYQRTKAAIADLESNHKDWLADYKKKAEHEARTILVSEEVTRLRRGLSTFAGKVLKSTAADFLKLHEDCRKAALEGTITDPESGEFQVLKIKQYERGASLRVLSEVMKIVDRLETAAAPKAAPVFNNQNIQIPQEEKRTRFLRLEALEPLEGKGANNGN